MGYDERLGDQGRRFLEPLEGLVERADPRGTVAPRSRVLCAALGSLSQATYWGLGGTERIEEIGVAGAALSLLTKVDDEVIDDVSFHGRGPRCALRGRTRRYLAPTLESIRTGAPYDRQPRCRLAADVGRRIAELAECERRNRLLALITRGWSIQVDAVWCLSSAPRDMLLERVAEVTRNISGAWLSMIAMIGAVTAETRALTDDEIEAIFDWGFHIQRADALADLDKDRRQGLQCTWVGKLLSSSSEPTTTQEAYRRVAELGIDRSSVPAAAEVERLACRLVALPELHRQLHWIHRFLVHRYVVHEASCVDDAFAAEWRVTDSIWDSELREVTQCSAR